MILPTNTCFDDTGDFLESLARTGASASLVREFTVVHAICLSPDSGEPFVHAWVEHDATDMIWQIGIMDGIRTPFAMVRPALYETLRLQRFTRYTPEQVLAETDRSGHYGPWLEEYKELCRTDCRSLGAVTSGVYVPKG
jgi:hypothetical protein